MITRLELEQDETGYGYITEDKDGRYVRYDDIKHLLTAPEAGPTENTKSMARRLSAQAGWQDCTRCGAAILNVHPVGKPQKG